jgi:hypothetical protein
MADPKIPGRAITLAGVAYTVAPLKLSQFLALEDDLNRLAPGADNPARGSERLRIIARTVAAALGRNYDGMTEEKVLDLLDMGGYEAAFDAALGVSGLVPSGEAKPAETGSASPAFSTASPSPMDGATPPSAN